MFTYHHEILKLKLQNDVPELRSIEWYFEQDSVTDKNASIKAAPAITLTFIPGEFRQLSGTRIQSAITNFEVMLMTDSVIDGDKRLKKENPIDHMMLVDKIQRSLQFFSAKLSYLPTFIALEGTMNDQKMFNSLSRVSITPPHTPRKAILKSVQRFRGVFYDHGGVKTFTTIPKPPGEIHGKVEQAHDTFDYTFEETFD